MGIVLKDFRAKAKKMKDIRMSKEGGYDIGYPTGLVNLDFRNAMSYNGKKDGKIYKNYVLGLTDGSLNMIIGRSNSGKSTLALQIASYIYKSFPSGCVEIYHDDIEGGMNIGRRQSILNMTDEEYSRDYRYRHEGITNENVYQTIKMIYETKMEHYDDILYNTGNYDLDGKEIMKPYPTIYIVDSAAVLYPEKMIDTDDVSGSMAQAQVAKANKQLAGTLLQIIKTANIIVIFTNHINDDISINGMPKKPQLPFLKPGETLPGGKGFNFLFNNIIRIDDGAKLKEGEKFNIDGNLAIISLLKTRSNKAGKGVPIIFNQEFGFDNELSMLQLLADNKRLGGAGAHLYVGDRSDFKFANKNFKKLLAENEEFRGVVMTEVFSILKELIRSDEADVNINNDLKKIDISSNIRNMLMTE